MPARMLGVVGAGFMGSGIAESAARAGFEVVLVRARGAPAWSRSRARIGALRRPCRRAAGSSPRRMPLRCSRASTIPPSSTPSPARELVVEAVFEDPQLKGKLFRRLDELLPEETILASNTSSIPIAQLASWTSQPRAGAGAALLLARSR